MAGEAINFNNNELDDIVLPDAVPEFSGGAFSNWRANLLKPNQSKRLLNCDIEKLGKLRTRRGTVQIGDVVGGSTIIQGLTAFQTKDFNYIVAAAAGKIWQFTGTTWVQIATGGTVDNEDILIARLGLINNAAGYAVGDTVLTVDGIVGVVGVGDKLYFRPNLRTDPWEYTIAAFAPAGPANTTTITLEQPGLVFPVKDNWDFIVSRPAKVNNGAGYVAGATTMLIDGYTGVVNNGEYLVIKSENINHLISAHTETGGNTTSVTFAPGLISTYASANTTDPIVFAQGNDSIFFCDGLTAICAWNGKTLSNLGTVSFLDYINGSAYTLSRTAPPTAVKILVWFQNRLIASGIATEPDAVYFSDFLDPTSWDKDYQMMRIGGGDSDPITNLVPWTDYNMIVFKKNSIRVIDTDPAQNPDPTDPTLLVSSFGVKRVHTHLGCPAPWTAVQVGGGSSGPGSDVYFLDFDKKIRSIRRVLAAETQQELGDAVSLPVQDVFDRIYLSTIARSVGTYHNDHYIVAIPIDGAPRANKVMAYNMLTGSWCGEWDGWYPTCFALRQDLGDYSRMIFGQWDGVTATGSPPSPTGGRVCQWMDDLSLPDEVTSTYQDNGVPISTRILTRAITFNDPFNFKTGLSAEFEFDESVSANLTIQVVLDGVTQTPLIAIPFSTLTELALRLPFVLPFTLSASPGLLRKGFDLQRYGTWRELQFLITSLADKLSIRSIRVTGFMDTIQLQTVSFPQPVSATEFVTGDDGGAVTGDDLANVTVGP